MRSIFLVLIALAVGGCATQPVDPAERATQEVTEAKEFYAKGDNSNANYRVDVALRMPTGAGKVASLFTRMPSAQSLYFGYAEAKIDKIADPGHADLNFDLIQAAKDGGALTTNQADTLVAKLNARVASGNIDGTIPFTLASNVIAFPHLKSADHQRVMLLRSIKYLQSDDQYRRPIGEVMQFAEKSGKGSKDWVFIEAALPTMKVRRTELDEVGRFYPEYAKIRLQQSTARVFFQIKNGDRLLADDILKTLRQNITGVDWAIAPGPGVTTLVIERIRNDEKTSAERTETITYAQHQVNLFSAALLMPRNASYLFEVISGGAEIEYGYAVNATLNSDVTYDDLVRGKVGGSYGRCQNARIQNVFGGVNPAGFIANDDMQMRCNGSQAVQMDDLRKEVLSKITSSVLKVPAIAAVHSMN